MYSLTEILIPMDSVYLFILPGCDECLQMREELDEILLDMDSPPEVMVYDYGDDEDLFAELCIETDCRYTHRVAISNHRIKSIANDKVSQPSHKSVNLVLQPNLL